MRTCRSHHHPGRLPSGAVVLALSVAALGMSVPSAGAAPTSDPVVGAGKVQADVNGDGYADLVVGIETYRQSGASQSITVLFGSAAGLSPSRRQRVDVSRLPGLNVGLSEFRPTLVAGDFNGDGRSDVAFSGGLLGADRTLLTGGVYVMPGSPSGLVPARVVRWTQASPGIPGRAKAGDGFGYSLAAADFGGGPEADLAIGIPGDETSSRSRERSGAVQVLYGSAAGLSTTGSQRWTQASRGVPGTAEAGDRFGSALAAGDFDGRGQADLAVGIDGEDVPGARNAGAVDVLYSAGRLTAARAQRWSQASRGVPGSPESGDRFGQTLAAGSLTGPTRDDLIVGAPGEKLAGDGCCGPTGSVTALPGSSSGLTSRAAQTVTAQQLQLQHGSIAATSLAAADLGRGSYGDLIIGTADDTEDELATPAYVLYSDGSTLGHRQVLDANPVVAADFDGDGIADAAGLFFPDVVEFGPEAIEVYRGGSSGLTAPTRLGLDRVSPPDVNEGGHTVVIGATGSP